jgi:hypothetical protein
VRGAAAFVRRCVVLNLNPPDQDQGFIDWLVARGRVHPLAICEDARMHAARQMLDDPKKASRRATRRSGSPNIDLLTALHHLTRGGKASARPEDEIAADRIQWLQRFGAYALIKNAGQDQKRPPLPAPESRLLPRPTGRNLERAGAAIAARRDRRADLLRILAVRSTDRYPWRAEPSLEEGTRGRSQPQPRSFRPSRDREGGSAAEADASLGVVDAPMHQRRGAGSGAAAADPGGAGDPAAQNLRPVYTKMSRRLLRDRRRLIMFTSASAVTCRRP